MKSSTKPRAVPLERARVVGSLVEMMLKSGGEIDLLDLQRRAPALYESMCRLGKAPLLREARAELFRREMEAPPWTSKPATRSPDSGDMAAAQKAAALLDELRKLVARGVPISSSGLTDAGGHALYRRCREAFGTMAAVRAALGVDQPPKTVQLQTRPGVSKKRASSVVRRLRELAEQGVEPRARSLMPEHAELLDEIRLVFGGLARAVEMAGLPPPMLPDDLDGFARELTALVAVGVLPTVTRLREVGEGRLANAIVERFGSLQPVIDAAGIDVPRERKPVLPRTEILRVLREESKRRGGRVPILRDLPIDVRRSIEHEFGGLREALTAMGQPPLGRKWTRALVIDALAERVRQNEPIDATTLSRDRPDLFGAVVRHAGGFRRAANLARAHVARTR